MSSTPPTPMQAEAFARDVARLREHLATGALYSNLVLETEGLDRLPHTIEIFCGLCGKEQTFEHIVVGRTGRSVVPQAKGNAHAIDYKCRNCTKSWQSYMYNWAGNVFCKVGQTPQLPEKIDPRLKRALGDDSLPLYVKAIRSRSFGFGMGALSYLRRIVEDKTDALMDLLREERWASWDGQQQKEFENARTTFRYSDKIAYAAGKVLPTDAFASGRDAFTALHDVTSNGLHGLTEEQCLELFDRCNIVFTRSFQILHEHKRERDELVVQLNALKR